jgi:hypothetical protein
MKTRYIENYRIIDLNDDIQKEDRTYFNTHRFMMVSEAARKTLLFGSFKTDHDFRKTFINLPDDTFDPYSKDSIFTIEVMGSAPTAPTLYPKLNSLPWSWESQAYVLSEPSPELKQEIYRLLCAIEDSEVQ